jgi:hypothetical protein
LAVLSVKLNFNSYPSESHVSYGLPTIEFSPLCNGINPISLYNKYGNLSIEISKKYYIFDALLFFTK